MDFFLDKNLRMMSIEGTKENSDPTALMTVPFYALFSTNPSLLLLYIFLLSPLGQFLRMHVGCWPGVLRRRRQPMSRYPSLPSPHPSPQRHLFRVICERTGHSSNACIQTSQLPFLRSFYLHSLLACPFAFP